MPNQLPSQHITFGWNRESDELSMKAFMQKFSHDDLLGKIIPRLKDEEITSVVDLLSDLLRRHLSEKEYHNLFLDAGK